MFKRAIAAIVRKRLRDYPAVALVGPRQCGKTTLAKALSSTYFDIEQPSARLRLDVQWEALAASKSLAVLDEAQEWPELFARLRGAIDEDRKRAGRFLLLGSVSPALLRDVSESLAGRLSVVELTPLLGSERAEKTPSELWLYGGFPDGGILSKRRFPQWEKDYLRVIAERDLPQWGLPARPGVTLRLFQMLAALHGQIWNASQVGSSLGLSYHTVNYYLDFLEGAFLIRRLPPWLSNLKKRLVRSPKVYWRDSGLLHGLLGVSDMNGLLQQPWVGASWEGFVIEQITGELNAADHPIVPHFFRTSDGYEIDLVFELRGEIWAVEVKLTSRPELADIERLNRVADLIGAHKRVLVSQTREFVENGSVASCSLADCIKVLRRSLRVA